LRIAFVFDDTLDVFDGVQQHIVTLGRELHRRGHDVDYLVGETTHSPVPNTHSLSSNLMVSFNGNRMRMPVIAKRREIRRVLNAGHYDVFDVQAPYSPLLAGQILHMVPPHAGVVATYHIAPTGKVAYFAGKLLGGINHWSHNRVDEVVAVSPVAARYARKTAHVPSRVIANPVDVRGLVTTREQAGPEKIAQFRANGRHVVFVGRFVERKGASILIDALQRGEQHHIFPDGMHVTMAGNGPLLESCKAQASRLHIPVDFTGFIEESDKPALLASADVAVFPSTGGESFGIVLLEAIASGSRVVLAGDNPGYRSTLRNDDNSLFNVNDGDRSIILAQRIAQALTNQQWADCVHRTQTALLEQYDVTQVADQVETVYRQAMADRKSL
jgi:phosphatidylinositol alpha-mannosyltransferase